MTLEDELYASFDRMAHYVPLHEQHVKELKDGHWQKGKHFEEVVDFEVQNRLGRYATASHILDIIRMGVEDKCLGAWNENELKEMKRDAQQELETNYQYLINIIHKLGHQCR